MKDLITILFFVLGSSIQLFSQTVYHVARYCDSEAAAQVFNNHTDEFVIDYSIGCWNGANFDANIHEFTKEDIDVIFIGGDNTFSSSTALTIEEATFNDGKVFMVNFWSNRNFDASLPAVNAGNASYGYSLTVEDPENPVFAGLPVIFYNSGPNYNREHAIEKAGSTVLMRFDNGDPALLYWKYGNGYVIEWTLECMHQFIEEEDLDLINYRLLKFLLEGSIFILTSPNGGEYWQWGTEHSINWTTTDSVIENVNIWLSYDGGLTYNDLLFENISNDGKEPWTVPEAQCNTARIKIEGYDAEGVLVAEDESDGDFVIYTTPPINLDSGLVAYYPFNGNANDESGNDNDGVIHGALLTTDKFGNTNSAYNFNGSGNHISIPVDINFSVKSELTMVAWVKPSDVTPIRAIISHDNGGFDRTINIDSRGGGIGYSCFTGTGVLGYFPANVDQWVQVAVIYNQLTGTAILYQNLSSISGNTSFGTGWTYTWIGGNPSYDEYFSGTIDDIRIYDRALNEFEILALYHEGGWKIKPTFMTELNDQAACKYDSIAFEVIVEGIPPIHYQWQKDGIDIPGASDSVLIISHVQPEDDGEYRCIATNDYGSDTSNAALLTVEFTIPTNIMGYTNVIEYQLATYSADMQEGHTYEFIVEGGTKIDGTENSVTVYWGEAGQGFVKLIETSELGCIADTNTLNVNIGNLGIDDMEAQNLSVYPNPFTRVTTFYYSLTEPSQVSLQFYNAYGKLIDTPVNAHQHSGNHHVRWNAEGLPAGIYLIHLIINKEIITKKIIKL